MSAHPGTDRRVRTRRIKATIEALEEHDGNVQAIRCCRVQCGASFSTDLGDYFWARKGHVFKCCGRACVLTYTENRED